MRHVFEMHFSSNVSSKWHAVVHDCCGSGEKLLPACLYPPCLIPTIPQVCSLNAFPQSSKLRDISLE